MNEADRADWLAQLFDHHADRLYRLARRLAAQPQDALDLVQDTFLRAAGARHSIPADRQGEEAWLVRVLINVQRDQWRKQAVRRQHAREAVASPRPITRHAEDALVDRALVWQALDHLTPRRRAVVVMHEIEGLPVDRIASLLGITAITVRWHLSRGRRELAERISAKSGAHDEQPEQPAAGRRSTPSRSSAI